MGVGIRGRDRREKHIESEIKHTSSHGAFNLNTLPADFQLGYQGGFVSEKSSLVYLFVLICTDLEGKTAVSYTDILNSGEVWDFSVAITQIVYLVPIK